MGVVLGGDDLGFFFGRFPPLVANRFSGLTKTPYLNFTPPDDGALVGREFVRAGLNASTALGPKVPSTG